jgi:S1-C subfamily serine protease
MKKVGYTFLLLFCVAAAGCSSDSCVTSGGPFSRKTNKRIDFNEKLEQNLLRYINARTVRIVALGKILDEKGTLIKDYKPIWHGTGTILHSSKKYSLVQTAYHVVEKLTRIKKVSGLNYVVIVDRLRLEKRDINNKIVKVYNFKVHEVVYDKPEDLAVVKVPVNLGVCSKLAKTTWLGQNIRILGYPGLLGVSKPQLSYSKGYIGTTNIDKKHTSLDSKYSFRLGTFGFFGSSGAAVWNLKGEVVGVVNALAGNRVFGLFIPQQDGLYGKRVNILRKFYLKNKVFDIHM